MPENDRAATKQLEHFREIGISIIEINGNPTPAVWDTINKLGLRIYGNLGIRFPVSGTFAKPDSSLVSTIENRASTYLSQPSVKAIQLFEFGAIQKAEFRTAIAPFVEQLHKAGSGKIYFTTNTTFPDDLLLPVDFYIWDSRVTAKNITTLTIPDQPEIGGYRYHPSDNLRYYLSTFKRFLDATASSHNKAIFLDAQWLASMEKKYPQFTSRLRDVTSDKDVIFPIPKETVPQPDQSAIPVIVLFLVWGVAAFHYNSSPLYRKSLFRYFTAHKFFIDDIFRRQIRTPAPAFLIILQNALLLGAGIYASFNMLWSALGKEALFYHFPVIKILGTNQISLYASPFLLIFILSLISILWLYIPRNSSSSMVQITTIYAWPLHINFIFGTLAITIFSSGGSPWVVAILTVFALLVYLLSFIFAAFDISRSRMTKPFLYLLGTGGLYLIVWAGLLVWILTNDEIREAVSLSLNLT